MRAWCSSCRSWAACWYSAARRRWTSSAAVVVEMHRRGARSSGPRGRRRRRGRGQRGRRARRLGADGERAPSARARGHRNQAAASLATTCTVASGTFFRMRRTGRHGGLLYRRLLPALRDLARGASGEQHLRASVGSALTSLYRYPLLAICQPGLAASRIWPARSTVGAGQRSDAVVETKPACVRPLTRIAEAAEGMSAKRPLERQLHPFAAGVTSFTERDAADRDRAPRAARRAGGARRLHRRHRIQNGTSAIETGRRGRRPGCGGEDIRHRS